MNIAHTLAAQARQRPEQPAIVQYGAGRRRAVTYAELDRRATAAAAALHRDGLRPGDRVLVLVGMSIDLYVVLVALFRIGAVATFLDPSAGREHIDGCCAIARPVAMVGTAKAQLLRLASSGLRRIGRKYATGFSVLPARRLPISGTAPGSGSAEVYPAEADTPALLTFTSGSTGRPKAAVRAHGFLLAQHRALETSIALDPGETDLATLPIFALANLASGLTTVIPDADLRRPGFIDPDPVLAQMAAERPVRCTASPAFFERLIDSDGPLDPLRSLRKVYTGGAPVFPVLLDRLQRLLPEAAVVSVYGSTEAEPIAHVAWSEVSEADRIRMDEGGGLLAGPPVPEIALRILPNRWGRPLGPFSGRAFEGMALPAGEAGEIVVNGEHVLSGYLDGVGDEQTKIRVDNRVWHRTGDAGYLDESGRLWLLGRAEARITDARGSAYPFAVECAASGTPGLRRSALLAHGPERVLVVELGPEAASDTPARLQGSLAQFSVDRVLPVPRIPVDRRHNAKVDYPALRKLLQDLMPGVPSVDKGR